MMTWVMARLRAKNGRQVNDAADEPQNVTRKELVDLFADDLARPALQKRAKARQQKPRQMVAGCQSRFARSIAHSSDSRLRGYSGTGGRAQWQ